MKKKSIIAISAVCVILGVAAVLVLTGNRGNISNVNRVVENRFAEEIEKYHKENNQELIVVLSTFDTDEKGGDGEFNPNDTYTNWQWHLVKTADKKSWDIINWGY